MWVLGEGLGFETGARIEVVANTAELGNDTESQVQNRGASGAGEHLSLEERLWDRRGRLPT